MQNDHDAEFEDSQDREPGAGPGGSRRSRGPRGHQGRRRGARERKERVLHTRISDQLAEEIREFAEELRVPASNLVRNVLEEVFTVVDSVSGDVGTLMDDLVDEAESVRDRVRRQRRRRAHRRRGFHSSGSPRRSRADDEVEAEFRHDERAERAEASPGDGQAERAQASPGHEERGRQGSPGEDDASRPPAAELFPDVLGWQPLVLNRDTACGRCGLSLEAGESAFLGMRTEGLSETALCGPCASSKRGRRR